MSPNIKKQNHIKQKKPANCGLHQVTQSGFEPETYCLEGDYRIYIKAIKSIT
jgi:hypothetical protein